MKFFFIGVFLYAIIDSKWMFTYKLLRAHFKI